MPEASSTAQDARSDDRRVDRGDADPDDAKDGRYLWGAVVAVAAAAAVVLAEVDALSAHVPVPPDGLSWPLGSLFGFPWGAAQGWRELVAAQQLDGHADVYWRLLLTHLVADWALVGAYALLLGRLAVACFEPGRARLVALGILAAGVVSDLVEDALAGLVLLGQDRVTPLVVGATRLKWCLLGVFALLVVVRLVVPRPGGRVLSRLQPALRAARAVRHHRFTVALAVPLLVLSVLSGHPILEQLPDAQRRWVSDGGLGVLHLTMAAVALGAAAAVAESFGRYRTAYAHRNDTPPAAPTGQGLTEPPPLPPGWLRRVARRLLADLQWLGRLAVALVRDRAALREQLKERRERDDALLAVWVVGPVLALAGALVTVVGWPDADVLEGRLLVFCAVPLVVLLASWLLRGTWAVCTRWDRPAEPAYFSDEDFHAIAFAGPAVTLSILSIGGLGLLRSYTSMALLTGSAAEERWSVWVLLALGVLLAVLPWLVAWRLSRESASRRGRRGRGWFDRGPTRLRPRWALVGLAIAVFLCVASFPTWLGRWGGVAAVAVLAISSLVSLPGAALLLIQERPPAELFRLLGFRRTPLVTLLVLTVVLVGLASGRGSINEVDLGTGSARQQDTRRPMSEIVGHWFATSSATACTVTVDGRRVRPMLLVAAEGGGIRAAYWTVGALDRIARSTPPVPAQPSTDAGPSGCGARSTLLSGGASGGSVGLTVARFSGTSSDPGTGRALASVEAMAEPATLASAVIGTFDRDPLYAATGVPVPADGPVPARTWADRARLIEQGWTGSHRAGDPAWGDRRFLEADSALSPATGELVLNSSSAQSKCRVWVSQVRFDLQAPPPAAGEQTCEETYRPAPRTTDLFTAYGPFVREDAPGGTCLRDVSASTAALLTARFPYVTPGGVVGDCPDPRQAVAYWPRDQLVDGGYLENSGLGTITDLGPEWSAQVRAHNADALADGQPLIVPIVVYLTNEEGKAVQPAPLRRPLNDLLVPPLTIIGGGASLGRTDALLKRATDLVEPGSFCPQTAEGSAPECVALARAFPRRVVVVDRATRPEVSAPLGWTLSAASTKSLDRGLDHALSTRCLSATGPTYAAEPVCQRGYASLGDLVGYLGGS